MIPQERQLYNRLCKIQARLEAIIDTITLTTWSLSHAGNLATTRVVSKGEYRLYMRLNTMCRDMTRMIAYIEDIKRDIAMIGEIEGMKIELAGME